MNNGLQLFKSRKMTQNQKQNIMPNGKRILINIKMKPQRHVLLLLKLMILKDEDSFHKPEIQGNTSATHLLNKKVNQNLLHLQNQRRPLMPKKQMIKQLKTELMALRLLLIPSRHNQPLRMKM